MKHTWLRYGCYGLLTAAAVIWAFPGLAQQGSKTGDWRSYASDLGSTRYSAADLITRDTVKNLQVAWSYRFDNVGGGTSETTPIMVDGVL